MKALVRVSVLVLVGGFVALAVVAGGGEKKAVAWAAGDVKWVESPAMKGLSIATLWGDPSQGAYGVFKKVPGGSDLGWHTHSSDQKVVGIAGTFDFQIDGQDPKVLSTGSYVFMPGGVKHSAKCRAGADCVYFEESQGKSDYIPAK